LVDVFVYVVVLNLFIEYLPFVISETFTLSLLTAVLLKFVLEVVLVAKNRVKARVKGAATPGAKLVTVLMLWAVLFGSKFLVLEAVAIVFGSRVSLGGFFSVMLLIILLLLVRGWCPSPSRDEHLASWNRTSPSITSAIALIHTTSWALRALPARRRMSPATNGRCHHEDRTVNVSRRRDAVLPVGR
jgi:hypothetical protein